MRILYLHRTKGMGVEGVHIGEIVRAWRNMGHEVRLASPVGESLGEDARASTAAPSLRARLIRLVSERLPELLFELAEIAYNVPLYRQARRLASPPPALVFERYAIFGIAGSLLAGRRGVPHVLEVNYTSRSALVRERSALLRPLARRVDQWLFRRAAGLVAVSSALRDHLQQEFGVPAEKIIVLPNAADPAVFDPRKLGSDPTIPPLEGKIVGFVGGFYPWHGLNLLLDAFVSIADRHPEARLVLIGDGPMRKDIEARAAGLGLAGRIVLPGRVSHRQLPAAMAGFHLGVMPDSNDYGSPMKVFEYMALEKPVVVPDYGPLRDAVDDGVEGIIFPAGNVDALAGALSRLLTDDALRTRLGRQARQRILTRHNWHANAAAILELRKGATEHDA